MLRSYKGKSPKIHPSAFVSETAYIVGNVEIEANVSIWPGSVIRADTLKSAPTSSLDTMFYVMQISLESTFLLEAEPSSMAV